MSVGEGVGVCFGDVDGVVDVCDEGGVDVVF